MLIVIEACFAVEVAPAITVGCQYVVGFSNNEAEPIVKECAFAGCDVLFHTALQAAGIVS